MLSLLSSKVIAAREREGFINLVGFANWGPPGPQTVEVQENWFVAGASFWTLSKLPDGSMRFCIESVGSFETA